MRGNFVRFEQQIGKDHRGLGSDAVLSTFVAFVVALAIAGLMTFGLGFPAESKVVLGLSFVCSVAVWLWTIVRLKRFETKRRDDANRLKAETREAEVLKQIDEMRRKNSNVPKVERP